MYACVSNRVSQSLNTEQPMRIGGHVVRTEAAPSAEAETAQPFPAAAPMQEGPGRGHSSRTSIAGDDDAAGIGQEVLPGLVRQHHQQVALLVLSGRHSPRVQGSGYASTMLGPLRR